ncbi:MAG: RluA family pseudouridine synthase [Acidobacteriota bacterium]
MKEFTFVFEGPSSGPRLDQYLAQRLDDLSRSSIQRLIAQGHCTVRGEPARPASRLRPGDTVQLRMPPPDKCDVEPEDIPLDVLYEDDDIVAINKPAGMVVHPAPGNRRGTLVSSLLFHVRGLAGVGGVERPGIVHRLDRGTTGVMVVAKTEQALTALQAQFKARSVAKTYVAIVWGTVKADHGEISLAIGRSSKGGKMQARTRHSSPRRSREAVTRYQVVSRYQPWCSLLHVSPATGRTHQIRVHLSSAGHPLVGDPTYGKGGPRRAPDRLRDFPRPALHAWRLRIHHPRKDFQLTFEAPLPADLSALLDYLHEQTG